MSNIDIQQEIYVIPSTSLIPLPFQLVHAGTANPLPWERYRRDHFERMIIEFVIEGEGTVQIEDDSFQPSQGDVYVLPYQKSHDYFGNPDKLWKKIFFCIKGNLATDLFKLYHLHQSYFFPKFNDAKIFFEIFELSKNYSSDIHQKCFFLFHQLLLKLSENQDQQKPPLHPLTIATQEILEQAITEPISLDEICHKLNRSKEHLIRVFKKDLGITPHQYYLQKKIEYAKYLLTDTSLSIKEIAFKLKFADEFYFSNVFKQNTSMAPSQYRKRAN